MLPHASQAIAMALLAGLMLIGAGAVRAQAQEPAPAEPNDVRVDRFRQQLEGDRERLKIPGLSAVILEDGDVVWTQGFGYADVERHVPATPDTLYHIASVTKTFTAILVLQLVEQGKLDLDAPVSRYVPEITDDRVRIKHLLSHTSEGTPGDKFSYNPERFEHLKAVLEQVTGKPLRELFVETFLEPLAMRDSVPGPDVVDDGQTWALLGETNLERYRRSLARVAQIHTTHLLPDPGRTLQSLIDLAALDFVLRPVGAKMTNGLTAHWFFDVLSPFSYLHLRQFEELHSSLELKLVPVLFAGLLRRWGTKGPAELPSKRIHTYRYCAWTASRHGIPFRMPSRHPFNPLSTLRLLVALGPARSHVEQVFDFIYDHGRDPERDWRGLCDALQVTDADALVADPAVKQQLIANTEQAADAGVFGVPTFVVRGQLFWGADTIDWMNAFVDDPGMFDRGEMRRAAQIEFGVHRTP